MLPKQLAYIKVGNTKSMSCLHKIANKSIRMAIWYLKCKRKTSNISTNHHENLFEKGSAQHWVLKFQHYLQNY
jgi:hypothetical protein